VFISSNLLEIITTLASQGYKLNCINPSTIIIDEENLSVLLLLLPTIYENDVDNETFEITKKFIEKCQLNNFISPNIPFDQKNLNEIRELYNFDSFSFYYEESC
jgi:hypothetical protein